MHRYHCPYCNNNQRGLLFPFIGGALIGGLGGYVLSKQNQNYYPYYPYPYNPYPYGSYPYNNGYPY